MMPRASKGASTVTPKAFLRFSPRKMSPFWASRYWASGRCERSTVRAVPS